MTYSSKARQNQKRSFLDPRTKIFLMFMVVIFVFSAVGNEKSKYIARFVSFMPFLLLLLEGRWKKLIRGMFILFVGYAFILISTLLESGISYTLFSFMGFLIIKLVPTIVMGMYLMSSISISEFVAAMERMKIPQSFTIPMAVIFRFFPTLIQEFNRINEAIKIRGIRLGEYSMVEVLEYRIVPLIISSVKIGDELSMSALTRGLTSTRERTNICCIGIRLVDIAIYLIFIVLLVLVFI